MNDYYCNICNKKLKLKYKKKHLERKLHTNLSNFIVNKYRVKNPNLSHVKQILAKYFINHGKKFAIDILQCEWKFQFENDTVDVKSDRTYYVKAYDIIIEKLEKILNVMKSWGLNSYIYQK